MGPKSPGKVAKSSLHAIPIGSVLAGLTFLGPEDSPLSLLCPSTSWHLYIYVYLVLCTIVQSVTAQYFDCKLFKFCRIAGKASNRIKTGTCVFNMTGQWLPPHTSGKWWHLLTTSGKWDLVRLLQ